MERSSSGNRYQEVADEEKSSTSFKMMVIGRRKKQRVALNNGKVI